MILASVPSEDGREDESATQGKSVGVGIKRWVTQRMHNERLSRQEAKLENVTHRS